MKWKLLPILSLLSLLITPLTPVHAEGVPIYIEDIEYKDSVFVIPRTSEETLVQTGSVYTTKEATKTDKGYSLGKQIGTVFKAQNKDGLLTPDGTQKENFVPDLRNGPLRESCLIPLTEGSIWVYSHGLKRELSIEQQKLAKNLIEVLDGQKLTEKVKELGIKTKLTELELLECEQIALVEILEQEEYKTLQEMSKEKLSIVKQLKEMAGKRYKLPTQKSTDLTILSLTSTTLELNRKPNENEYISLVIDGKETRMTEKRINFSVNTKVEIKGFLKQKVCCYIKDIPNLRTAVGVEKESRDSVGMNYIGMVLLPYKEITVKDKKFVFTDYTPSNDILELSRTEEASQKLEIVIVFLRILNVILVVLLFILQFMWLKGEK